MAAPLARAALWAALALLPAACLPPQASYELGLGTSHINGLIRTEAPQTAPGGPLVVAYLYHQQFITQGDGSALLSATARVIRPASTGQFSLPVDVSVVRADVLFIAPDYVTQIFRFQRQVGVGDISYTADLERSADWRSHYYTYLSPQLEALILEQRYRVPPAEQQALGTWMREQDARLKPAPLRSAPEGAAPDAPGSAETTPPAAAPRAAQ